METIEPLTEKDQTAASTIGRYLSLVALADGCNLVSEGRERLRIEWETHSRRYGPETDETILEALRQAGVR